MHRLGLYVCIYRQEYYYWIHRELSQKDMLVKGRMRLAYLNQEFYFIVVLLPIIR